MSEACPEPVPDVPSVPPPGSDAQSVEASVSDTPVPPSGASAPEAQAVEAPAPETQTIEASAPAEPKEPKEPPAVPPEAQRVAAALQPSGPVPLPKQPTPAETAAAMGDVPPRVYIIGCVLPSLAEWLPDWMLTNEFTAGEIIEGGLCSFAGVPLYYEHIKDTQEVIGTVVATGIDTQNRMLVMVELSTATERGATAFRELMAGVLCDFSGGHFWWEDRESETVHKAAEEVSVTVRGARPGSHIYAAFNLPGAAGPPLSRDEVYRVFAAMVRKTGFHSVSEMHSVQASAATAGAPAPLPAPQVVRAPCALRPCDPQSGKRGFFFTRVTASAASATPAQIESHAAAAAHARAMSEKTPVVPSTPGAAASETVPAPAPAPTPVPVEKSAPNADDFTSVALRLAREQSMQQTEQLKRELERQQQQLQEVKASYESMLREKTTEMRRVQFSGFKREAEETTSALERALGADRASKIVAPMRAAVEKAEANLDDEGAFTNAKTMVGQIKDWVPVFSTVQAAEDPAASRVLAPQARCGTVSASADKAAPAAAAPQAKTYRDLEQLLIEEARGMPRSGTVQASANSFPTTSTGDRVVKLDRRALEICQVDGNRGQFGLIGAHNYAPGDVLLKAVEAAHSASEAERQRVFQQYWQQRQAREEAERANMYSTANYAFGSTYGANRYHGLNTA